MSVNGHDHAQPEQPQPQVPIGPMPVPMAWTMQQARTADGQAHVVLVINGPTGSFVAFLDPDAASRLADQLTQHAVEARSGIQIARNGGLHLPGRG